MQANEFRQRFHRIEQCLHDAVETCERDANVSPQLAENIRDLDRETRDVHQLVFDGQQEPEQLAECIDRLEEIGDNVKRACQSSLNVSQDMQDAVLDLHNEISALKHRLH